MALMLHILAIGQHYFTTFDDLEDVYLPGVPGADFFNRPFSPPSTVQRERQSAPCIHWALPAC